MAGRNVNAINGTCSGSLGVFNGGGELVAVGCSIEVDRAKWRSVFDEGGVCARANGSITR